MKWVQFLLFLFINIIIVLPAAIYYHNLPYKTIVKTVPVITYVNKYITACTKIITKTVYPKSCQDDSTNYVNMITAAQQACHGNWNQQNMNQFRIDENGHPIFTCVSD